MLWIRPTQWNKNGYIPSYKSGDDNYINPKSNAISWPKAIKLLNIFLNKHGILVDDKGSFKNGSKSFMSAICGNWDIKTQIPKQCKICNIELPKYFNHWMNIKDFALSVYPQYKPYQVKGMASLLRTLNMKLYGTHHLGMDDTYNISRLVIQFIVDKNNAIFDYTAYRNEYGKVFYKNNNRRVSRYHTSKQRNNYSDKKLIIINTGDSSSSAKRHNHKALYFVNCCNYPCDIHHLHIIITVQALILRHLHSLLYDL